MRKRITVETDPILAVEKNVDAMKLFEIDDIKKNSKYVKTFKIHKPK